MAEWQPIETAPKIEGVYYLGFDAETARAFGDPRAGVCAITWVDVDDDEAEEGFEPEWQVQPFSEGMDCITSETQLTHWMPLPPPPSDIDPDEPRGGEGIS